MLSMSHARNFLLGNGHEYLNKLFSHIFHIPLRQPTERPRMLKELALIVTLLALFADARPQRYVIDRRGPSHNSGLSANLKGKVALVCINHNPCVLIYLGAERLTIAGGVRMNQLLFFHDAIYPIVPCITTYSGH